VRTFDVVQGSDEWKALRAGVATASEFSSILAKGQGKTRAAYMRRMVAERLIGAPMETYKNAHMVRGNEQEPDGREEYVVRTMTLVDTIGFAMHDTLLAGSSPDGLVGLDGGLEIKSVIPTTQLDTIEAGGYPSEHKAQIQGNLWITGRQWWDFASFCPLMPANLRLYTFRVERDEKYIQELETEVRRFLVEVEQAVNKFRERRVA